MLILQQCMYDDLELSRERDVAQWLKRSPLQLASACRASSRIAWCQIVREISCFPLQRWDSDLSMLCPWARHFTLKCFTSLRCKWVPGMTEMAIFVRQVTSATLL